MLGTLERAMAVASPPGLKEWSTKDERLLSLNLDLPTPNDGYVERVFDCHSHSPTGSEECEVGPTTSLSNTSFDYNMISARGYLSKLVSHHANGVQSERIVFSGRKVS